jgi:hypothetical protein
VRAAAAKLAFLFLVHHFANLVLRLLAVFRHFVLLVATAGEVPTSVTELRREIKGRCVSGNMAADALAPSPDFLAPVQTLCKRNPTCSSS